jgi:hypothetical protein
MPADDLAHLRCQNSSCPRQGQRGGGDLSICGHFGKAHQRLLYCTPCRPRSSELKGIPLFNRKLSHDKVLAILEHPAEGCGVRHDWPCWV